MTKRKTYEPGTVVLRKFDGKNPEYPSDGSEDSNRETFFRNRAAAGDLQELTLAGSAYQGFFRGICFKKSAMDYGNSITFSRVYTGFVGRGEISGGELESKVIFSFETKGDTPFEGADLDVCLLDPPQRFKKYHPKRVVNLHMIAKYVPKDEMGNYLDRFLSNLAQRMQELSTNEKRKEWTHTLGVYYEGRRTKKRK